VPDPLPVLVDLPHPVEGDGVDDSFIILNFKEKMVLLGELDLPEGDQEDPVLHAVVVADVEIPFAELSVPLDAVQNILNGFHG